MNRRLDMINGFELGVHSVHPFNKKSISFDLLLSTLHGGSSIQRYPAQPGIL